MDKSALFDSALRLQNLNTALMLCTINHLDQLRMTYDIDDRKEKTNAKPKRTCI